MCVSTARPVICVEAGGPRPNSGHGAGAPGDVEPSPHPADLRRPGLVTHALGTGLLLGCSPTREPSDPTHTRGQGTRPDTAPTELISRENPEGPCGGAPLCAGKDLRAPGEERRLPRPPTPSLPLGLGHSGAHSHRVVSRCEAQGPERAES